MEGSRSAPESSVCIASSATAQRPTRRWVPQENSLMRSCKVATSQVPGTAGSAECVCKNSSAQSCLKGNLAPCFLASPNLDYDGYHKYVDEMLPSESPVLYGLHPYAEMGFLSTSDNLFKTPLEKQALSPWERDQASLQ
ncbi:uncharacterized protein [Molothrus aeneus]|uniref:uncharacterized protein isoform X2 n=1 Tax=Molothrus aeneus TaxID=84833 RepID=UPI00345AE258